MKIIRYLLISGVALLIIAAGCSKSAKNATSTNTVNQKDTVNMDTDTTVRDTDVENTTTNAKTDVGKDRPLSLNFTLTTLDGKSFTLHDNKGKVIVMDFWATWCGPCRREIPELIKLNDKLKKKGLLVIGVGLDRPAQLNAFAKQYKIDYPILLGTQQIANDYGVKGIPTTYILDKKGRVIKRYVGYYPGVEKEMLSIIESALKE